MPLVAGLTRRHKKSRLSKLRHKRRESTARSLLTNAIAALRGERVTAARAHLRAKAAQLARRHRAPDRTE